jgi:AcrR family transcriptional regulator
MKAGRPSSPSSPPAEAPARDRIFAVAKDMFYRLGIRAVGVETICAEAGATKMSLYRSFPSKDELVAAYLRDRNGKYWGWWDKIVDAHPGDPRAQLLGIFTSIAASTTRVDYRGCPFTNAAIEFPEPDHPGRAVAAENKRDLRERLRGLAKQARARDAVALADGLLLLIEGAYTISQTLGPSGPAKHLVAAAEALIAANVKK